MKNERSEDEGRKDYNGPADDMALGVEEEFDDCEGTLGATRRYSVCMFGRKSSNKACCSARPLGL